MEDIQVHHVLTRSAATPIVRSQNAPDGRQRRSQFVLCRKNRSNPLDRWLTRILVGADPHLGACYI